MELEFLKKIVQEAAELSQKDIEVQSKGEESDLVTNLDYEIEKFLIQKIKEEYPNFDIVSEETNTKNELTDNCFIIDPIDGTVNFANNLSMWGIQIACRKDGKTIAAVIYLPKFKELYFANLNGAYLNDKKISVKEVPIKKSIYSVDGPKAVDYMVKMFKYSKNKRSFGATCVSMAYMACGKLHAAIATGDNPWDYEPGLFICKMAGAKVKNYNGFHAAAMNEEYLKVLDNAMKGD